jgi:anti-sigma regulatory factor (Ser/Thr protein kinase)
VQELTRTLLRDESTRDDVCVLLLAWNGSVFERHVGADLGTLSATRHALGRWLSSQGADHATRMDVVLAVSEALANAAEHGLSGDPTECVRLRAVVDRRTDGRDEVVVTVHDPGRWRTPDPLSDRGRGLRIIEALVDDMLVRHEQGTTVVLRSGLRKGPS